MTEYIIQVGHDSCPNCKIIKPLLEEIAQKIGAHYLEINVFENRELLNRFSGANTYEYQTAPTVFYCKGLEAKLPPIAEGAVPTIAQLYKRIERLR
jgi:thiol-disulfide isomerase/thioredoxin